MLDRDTGEIVEQTLRHEGETVRTFYASIPPPVVIGITSRSRSSRDATFRRIMPFANGKKIRINPRGFRVATSSTRVLSPWSKKRYST